MAPAPGSVPAAPKGRRKGLAQATLDSIRRSFTVSRPATAGHSDIRPNARRSEEQARSQKQGRDAKQTGREGTRRDHGESWSEVMPPGNGGERGGRGQARPSSGIAAVGGKSGPQPERRFWSEPQGQMPAVNTRPATSREGTRRKGPSTRHGELPSPDRAGEDRSGDEGRPGDRFPASPSAASGAFWASSQNPKRVDGYDAGPLQLKRAESARAGPRPESAQALRSFDGASVSGPSAGGKGSSSSRAGGALTRVMSVGSASKQRLFEPPSPSRWVSQRSRKAQEDAGKASALAEDEAGEVDSAPRDPVPSLATLGDAAHGALRHEGERGQMRAAGGPGQGDLAPGPAPEPPGRQEEPRRNLFEPPRQGAAAADGDALGLRRAAEVHARWGSPALRAPGASGAGAADLGVEGRTGGAPAGLGERTLSMPGLAAAPTHQWEESRSGLLKVQSLHSLAHAQSLRCKGDTQRSRELKLRPLHEAALEEGRHGSIIRARRRLAMPSWSDSDDESQGQEEGNARTDGQDASEQELRVPSLSDLVDSQVEPQIGGRRPSHEAQDGMPEAVPGSSDRFAFSFAPRMVDCDHSAGSSSVGEQSDRGGAVVVQSGGSGTAVDDQLARLKQSTSALRAAMQFMRSPSGADSKTGRGAGHAGTEDGSKASWLGTRPTGETHPRTKRNLFSGKGEPRADERDSLGESSHDVILSSLLREPSLMDLVGLASGAPGSSLADALQSSSSGSAGSSRRFLLRHWEEKRAERSCKARGGAGLDEQAEAKAKFRKELLDDPAAEPESDIDAGLGADAGFQFPLGWASGLAEHEDWAGRGQRGSALEDQGQYAYESTAHSGFWSSEGSWKGHGGRAQARGPGQALGENQHWKGKDRHGETDYSYTGSGYTSGVPGEWREGHGDASPGWGSQEQGRKQGSWRETAAAGWGGDEAESCQDELGSDGTPLEHLRREFEMMQAEGLILRWNERDGGSSHRDHPVVHHHGMAAPHREGYSFVAENKSPLFQRMWGQEEGQEGLGNRGPYREEMALDTKEPKGKDSEEWREKMQKQLLTKWCVAEKGGGAEEEDEWMSEKCQPVSISQRRWNSHLEISRN